MKASEDYRPRFIFEITEEQKQRADRYLSTYGLRKAVFGRLLDEVLDLVEEYGGMTIGIIMDKNIRPREIIPSMKSVEEVGKK